MRVLVTGGAGYLGSVLCERLPGPLTDELRRVVSTIRELASPDVPWPQSEDEEPR